MPRWFQGPRCTNVVRLDGKVAVITGANTGIGKETARELSRRGAQVVIACRDIQKAGDAAREISSETKNSVTTLKLDLASLSSIRTAAQNLKVQQPKIHLLINNAGIMVCPQWKTEDDFEMQLGVNHLGHFLWTLMLLDNVKQAAPSRIINVSSIAHTRGNIDFDDIMMEKNYDPTRSYCRSKLANVLFSKELANRLNGTGVTCYSLHPGVVQTELGRHLRVTTNRLVDDMFHWFGQYFFKTPEMGAQTTIYCATEPSLSSRTGLYYSDCAEERPARQAENKEAARRLWEISEKLVNFSYGSSN
ncbi:retinol dehydrogenase 11-like [Daphnia pulex]|uniref:retinol dehydrogenase 11-like n=1 Tax=Daphnia pulex TaxID=6669 RepID=UPI001EDED61A|nr:retinol dehydrogenase 11-like [Daphnia pulex]